PFDSYLKVKVRTCRSPVVPDLPDGLSFFHFLALTHFHLVRPHMGIQGRYVLTMINFNIAAIGTGEMFHFHHGPAVGSYNRGPDHTRKILSGMKLAFARTIR